MFLFANILSEVRISDQIGTLQNVQRRIAPVRLKHGSDNARAIFNWTRLILLVKRRYWRRDLLLLLLLLLLMMMMMRWWWQCHFIDVADFRRIYTSKTSNYAKVLSTDNSNTTLGFWYAWCLQLSIVLPEVRFPFKRNRLRWCVA